MYLDQYFLKTILSLETSCKRKKGKNLFPFKNLVYRFYIKACLLVLQSHFSNCLGLVSNLLFLLRYYFPMINPLIFVLTVKREFKSTFTVLTLCAIRWITHRFAFIRKLNTGTSKKYKWVINLKIQQTKYYSTEGVTLDWENLLTTGGFGQNVWATAQVIQKSRKCMKEMIRQNFWKHQICCVITWTLRHHDHQKSFWSVNVPIGKKLIRCEITTVVVISWCFDGLYVFLDLHVIWPSYFVDSFLISAVTKLNLIECFH